MQLEISQKKERRSGPGRYLSAFNAATQCGKCHIDWLS